MASRRSFFGRVARYTGGATDQRENRLTELFAVVLEAVPVELVLKISRAWVAPTSPFNVLGESGADESADEFLASFGGGSIAVTTQKHLVSGAIPDLLIEFRDSEGSSMTLGVEVKRGAPLSGDQLDAYQQSNQIDATVLLAPRGQLPSLRGELEAVGIEGVPVRAWEAVGRVLSETSLDSEVETWIVEQFVAYLREEGLMPPDKLETKHLVALAWNGAAESGLNALMGLVRDMNLIKEWSPGRSTKIKPTGYDSYLHWELPGQLRESWPSAWLELKATTSPIPVPEGVNPEGEQLLFIAGLSSGDAATASGFTDALTTLPPGFLPVKEAGSSVHRLVRVSTPENVLKGETLDAQAQSLANWARDAFLAIAPPEGSSNA